MFSSSVHYVRYLLNVGIGGVANGVLLVRLLRLTLLVSGFGGGFRETTILRTVFGRTAAAFLSKVLVALAPPPTAC